jgi:hypothetical protein
VVDRGGRCISVKGHCISLSPLSRISYRNPSLARFPQMSASVCSFLISAALHRRDRATTPFPHRRRCESLSEPTYRARQLLLQVQTQTRSFALGHGARSRGIQWTTLGGESGALLRPSLHLSSGDSQLSNAWRLVDASLNHEELD